MQASIEVEPPEASRRALISSIDDLVTVAAEARLLRSRYAEIRRVSCDFHRGTLTLRGYVSRYYLKQIAQNIVGQLAGVVEIDNQVQVATRHDPLQTGRPSFRSTR